MLNDYYGYEDEYINKMNEIKREDKTLDNARREEEVIECSLIKGNYSSFTDLFRDRGPIGAEN